MKIRFYLCSSTSEVRDMEYAAGRLIGYGHEVVSRWHSGELGSPRLELDDPGLPKRAKDDLGDIARANVVIIGAGEASRGGRHFEAGYAYGIGRQLWLVGDPEHAFHTLATMQFPTWGSLFDYVEGLKGNLYIPHSGFTQVT
jgi:hypothetical protein